MCTNWFFRRNRCCCCCRRGCSRNTNASAVYTVYYARHFANVPMRVFYGPGYTERNVLESIDDSLQTMAEHSSGWEVSSCNRCNCRSRCSC